MALVVPLSSSANVISNILFKVRRGIALSRNASQANPATGVMVDLPEKIDFEMTLLKTHQSLTFQRITNTIEQDSSLDSKGGVSSETSLSSKTSSDSDIKQSAGNETNNSTDNTIKSAIDGESSGQGAGESSRGTDNETTTETSAGKTTSTSTETNTATQTDTTAEDEVRCTNQDHRANRYYDKYDTDTGSVQGISG
jgi:hypothetical protein